MSDTQNAEEKPTQQHPTFVPVALFDSGETRLLMGTYDSEGGTQACFQIMTLRRPDVPESSYTVAELAALRELINIALREAVAMTSQVFRQETKEG
jgi:hypothetical protein